MWSSWLSRLNAGRPVSAASCFRDAKRDPRAWMRPTEPSPRPSATSSLNPLSAPMLPTMPAATIDGTPRCLRPSNTCCAIELPAMPAPGSRVRPVGAGRMLAGVMPPGAMPGAGHPEGGWSAALGSTSQQCGDLPLCTTLVLVGAIALDGCAETLKAFADRAEHRAGIRAHGLLGQGIGQSSPPPNAVGRRLRPLRIEQRRKRGEAGEGAAAHVRKLSQGRRDREGRRGAGRWRRRG